MFNFMIDKEILHKKFLSKVTKNDLTGCWEWNASLDGQGYGRLHYGFYKNPERYRSGAHRFSYSYYKGEIPSKLYVCHTCDNKKCVNPDHLFLGTSKDNQLDCERKNRSANRRLKISEANRGSSNHSSKLTEADVKKILEFHKQGYLQREIVEIFNVQQACVSKIILRKSWKHLQAN